MINKLADWFEMLPFRIVHNNGDPDNECNWICHVTCRVADFIYKLDGKLK